MQNKDRGLTLHDKLYQKSLKSRIEDLIANNGKSISPWVIELDPTTACNLACHDCISANLLNQGGFERDRIKDLAREFKDFGIKAVVLIGGGEPMAHPEFGTLVDYFYDSDDDPLDDSQNKHGTVQTQIIASKATTEEVNIIPLKITGPNKQSSGKIVNAAVKYATGLSETRVIVKSAGTQCRSKTYMRISNAGKVFILPAGNHSSTKPVSEANVVSQMEGRGVVVGALDENNKIAPYSNRAGGLADFYITAPGFSSYSSVKGTSYATSHVAALAAQILARAPELSAEEVVDIIFRSAKDAGAPGADDVYGRGIIDPSAALGPLGEIVLIDDPTESEDPTESGGSAGAGALIVGGAVALAILQGGDLLNKAIVVDEYNRVFTANILKKISYRGMFNNAEKGFLEMFDWFAKRDEKESNHLKSGLNNFSIESIGLIPGPSYSLGINRIPYGFFNEHRENNISLRLGNPNDYLRDQIMGFDDHGIFGSYNTIDAFGTKWSLMGSKVVPEGKYGLDSYSLKIKRKREGERLNVGISLGTLNEVGNLLGGSSGGALSVEESSTLSIGIEADYHIHKNYILRGSYINGFTFVVSSVVVLYISLHILSDASTDPPPLSIRKIIASTSSFS